MNKKFNELNVEELSGLLISMTESFDLPQDVILCVSEKSGNLKQLTHRVIEDRIDFLLSSGGGEILKGQQAFLSREKDRIINVKESNSQEFRYDHYWRDLQGWRVEEDLVNSVTDETLRLAGDGYIYTKSVCPENWERWERLAAEVFEPIKESARRVC